MDIATLMEKCSYFLLCFYITEIPRSLVVTRPSSVKDITHCLKEDVAISLKRQPYTIINCLVVL